MKLIVAGMPKTGTKSVTTALKMLGYEVYDIMENLHYLEREWDEIFHRGYSTEKFRRMYKDIEATIDSPACYFWEEIHKAFPDAKIILTMRDSDEKWLQSVKRHFQLLDTLYSVKITQFIEFILGRKSSTLLSQADMLGLGIYRKFWTKKSHINDSISKMKYRSHNAYVLQKAPADKLLVFNCKQGWGPLCKFLDKPVPDAAFPHKNVAGAFVDELGGSNKLVEKYNKQLSIDLVKLIMKWILICVALLLFVGLLVSA